VTGGKPIAVLLQSISGVSANNPLVAFYDIHGGKREVLFFYFVPDTTRDYRQLHIVCRNDHVLLAIKKSDKPNKRLNLVEVFNFCLPLLKLSGVNNMGQRVQIFTVYIERVDYSK
jgi:hypothetical protein